MGVGVEGKVGLGVGLEVKGEVEEKKGAGVGTE